MTDSYQAIYDAVRSRIGYVDMYAVACEAFSNMGISQPWEMACHSIAEAHIPPPSALYRPSLSVDGNKWCALYGGDLQSGCAGFGDTPAEAMADFDRNWMTEKPPLARTGR